MLTFQDADISIVVAKGLTVPIGKLIDAGVLSVDTSATFDVLPPEGARSATVTFTLSNGEVVGFAPFLAGYRRYLGLRQQHKHKRRRGWRHIR